MTRRRLATLVAMVLGLVGPAWSTLGQGALPGEVIRTGQPAAQIQEYVNFWLTKLETGDVEAMFEGRDKLLEPLKDKNANVVFRQVYSSAAGARLQKLADSPDEGMFPSRSINAMRVAGAIATFESGTLLAGKLTDKEPARRLFAAAQLGRLWAAIDAGPPAINPLDAKQLADKLAAAIVTEKDANALRGMVLHLIGATRVAKTGFEDFRSSAFIALCQQLGKRVEAMKGEAGDAEVLRILQQGQFAVYEAVREALANPQRRLDPVAKKAALGLQGHMLAYVVRSRGAFPAGQPETRATAADVVRVAETACGIGLPEFNVQFEAQGLADDFKKATAEGDGVFREKALRLITVLESAPLNLGPFKTK